MSGRTFEGDDERQRPAPTRQPPRRKRSLEMMHLLREDPGLGHGLAPHALESASAAAIAPVVNIDVGPNTLLPDEPLTSSHLGLLILDGLIARHVKFDQITSTELLGPGDLMRPCAQPHENSGIRDVSWEVLTPTRVAVLDPEFAQRIRPWPPIVAALLDRAFRRADSQQFQSALRQARRVEDRLLLLLWHFAGRWGEDTPEGRTVALPRVTGETLAQIVGARRPAISLALGALTDAGAITRHANGRITLIQAPPTQIQPPEPTVHHHARRRWTDRKNGGSVADPDDLN